jgi:transcriptional regulator with XRE-family HTH domain
MDGGELKRRFGKRVQELREGKGLTQEQLAARIGRSVDTVSNIERGVNATRIETAHQLANELGVRLPELFDLEDESDPIERKRREAISSISKLLSKAEPDTISQLKELLEVGLRIEASSKPRPPRRK